MNLHAPNIIAATNTRHVLHRDYESRGVLKLEDVGAWRYAADPRTEVLCCAYAVDDDPVKLWLPGDPPPPEFFEAAAPQNTNWEVAAQNAQFEIALEHFKLCRHYGFPKFPLSRQRCTMAMALACSLPPKLELAADALELIHRKDKTVDMNYRADEDNLSDPLKPGVYLLAPVRGRRLPAALSATSQPFKQGRSFGNTDPPR